MEQTTNIIDKLYASKTFNRAMDVIRILMLIGVVLIIVILLTNISEVKLLNSDVCKLCMNKTGANCFYPVNTLP